MSCRNDTILNNSESVNLPFLVEFFKESDDILDILCKNSENVISKLLSFQVIDRKFDDVVER